MAQNPKSICCVKSYFPERINLPMTLMATALKRQNSNQETSWTYTYNALHQCTEAYSATCRVQFAYDALYRKSRRIVEQREDASQPWAEVDRLYFLYQGNEEVGSYRETGEYTSYRVLAYPENSVIPRTVYMELEGNWYVPQIDAQGSISHLLDPRTAVIASMKRHTAFGEVLSAGLPTGFLESSSGTNTSVSSPWGYFSKRLDPDLGLIDFGKRWYDPQQARWTTLDPAGFIDGTNLYRFVKNNPLLYTDPDGQFAIVIPIVQVTSTAVTWLLGKVWPRLWLWLLLHLVAIRSMRPTMTGP